MKIKQREEGVSFASKVTSKTKIKQTMMSISPNPEKHQKRK